MQDTPYGFCHCGCGEKTKLYPQTVRKLGQVKGEPKRYIGGHQSRKPVVEYLEEDLGYETPCWVWQRSVGPKGYGNMRPYGSKRMYPAHIVYYERAKGTVPEGRQLDHLCHDPDSCPGGSDCLHRRCVNPDHLEPVTPRENSYRGQTGPGSRHKPDRKKKARPAYCKHGHAFTPENTYVRPDGAWTCKECRRGLMLRAYYRRKARLASQ